MNNKIEYGISSKPKINESVNGDAYFIGNDNNTFLGVIADGLGHGMSANKASKAAVNYIADNISKSVVDLIYGCNKILKGTTGAALGIVKMNLSENKVEVAGVGDINFKAKSKGDFNPATISGTVGYNLRKVESYSYPLNKGDVICMFSDGISSDFELKEYLDMKAQESAEFISTLHRKELDDSTVMVLKHIAND